MPPRKQKKSTSRSVQPKRELQNTLRRTSRHIKSRNDDDFLFGQQEIDRCIGKELSQDEVGGKRGRRYNCYDQCSDYESNHRNLKKRPLTNNSVEALLEWKDQPHIPSTLTDLNSKVVKVKSICKQQLDRHAQNIEALFINIDWGRRGQTISDFRHLKIESIKLMEKGLLFIWAPKELIYEILQIMEEKSFFYVENLQIVNLDRQKAIALSKTCKALKTEDTINNKFDKKKVKEERITNFGEESQPVDLKTIINGLEGVDPNVLIHSNESRYFSSSKRTLLILRRRSDEKVELRHQRTCDVVFDMAEDPSGKCALDTKQYIYGMIETMLPKCLEEEGELKMLELFGDEDSRRRGWITIMQL